jgi:Protein of unknown function (DUF2637)
MKANGQGWARFGLGFGATLSIIGNVAHTVLVDSAVSLWLRVPFAMAWPIVLFMGIEVLVRVDWRQKFLDHAGRTVIWGPAGVVAAVVSYLHLHQLMIFAGETWFAALVGPLAIDGLMIGCTVALLAIRAATLAPEPEVIVHTDSDELPAPSPLPAVLRASEVGGQVGERVTQEMVTTARRQRASKPEQEKAVRMMLDGESATVLADGLMSRATLGTYEKAWRVLRDNPRAEIGDKVNGRTVRPELIAIIRDHANRGRAL